MGGLKHEADAIRHDEVFRPVPAGIVQLQHDALFGAGAGRFGKVGKDELEQFLSDGVGDVPHRPACRRLDEACHIEPFEPMVAECDRPLADRRPHAPHDRFQTDAMFIHRPDFNARAWVLAPFLVSRGRKLFLSAARSASVAASG